ncbi:nucleotide pyrophosphohydrolase [Microbulbifer yueqingensis]|uniref:NTP pyrophosphatase, house-cleaning of non-canonical NTPs n=1 Tax=Microbulbifer yueqingensis TaxID=658219 RepID=A0A1G8ZFL4_9GAMM|nr:nucleotide pyrophosphohydrolase [Microbulbifer yueqingensis]SDK13808.1 NTP pyrophosphatase, house-cleaning of non-canonical NTPs [Microbulbifer yueqingensis]
MDTGKILREFDAIACARGWQTLHSPKNLAMALAVEVAELGRHLQWSSDEEIRQLLVGPARAELAGELADIQMYLLKLASTMGIDLEDALEAKMAENRRRLSAGAGGKGD